MVRRWVLGIAMALLAISSVSAQGVAPRLVQSSDGTLYVVAGDVRYRVVPAPISDADLAAIGEAGVWEDGTLVLSAPSPAPAQPAAIAAPAAEQPVALSGTSDQNTRPFELRGGTYTARWSAQLQPRDASCFVATRLRRAADQRLIDGVFSETLNRRGPTSAGGETILYGVSPGAYYIDATSSGCDWSVTLSPGP